LPYRPGPSNFRPCQSPFHAFIPKPSDPTEFLSPLGDSWPPDLDEILITCAICISISSRALRQCPRTRRYSIQMDGQTALQHILLPTTSLCPYCQNEINLCFVSERQCICNDGPDAPQFIWLLSHHRQVASPLGGRASIPSLFHLIELLDYLSMILGGLLGGTDDHR
jgi:hypothetical protein